MDVFSLVAVAGIVLLVLSGFLDLIKWAFNIPAIVVLLVVWVGASYNRLIARSTSATEAWADIEVQLKRRYNLIPNLVETVKGYATHEREAFERVTRARAVAMGAKTPKEHGMAETALTGALGSLFAVAEAYPQLRAVESFVELQRELTDTEDKIQAARRFYNGNIRDLNIAVQSFPVNLIAGLFRFAPMEFFELGEGEEAAKEPVKVSF
jgi:LemA protein